MTSGKIILLISIILILFIFLLCFGETGFFSSDIIFWQLRLPKVFVAFFAGGILAVTGLLMQIFFQNPLAGPDILGVSAGSSLFMAFWIMAAGSFPEYVDQIGANIFSLLGAFSVFGILLFFLHKNFSRLSLLIVGLLISSFSSSCISFLINMSTNLQTKNYLLWTLGSFRNATIEEIPYFFLIVFVLIISLFFLPKTLNQFQLGENYSQTMGVNISKTKKILITFCAVAISAVTYFCGPICFIGVIAPHLARFFLKQSNMKIILPVTFFFGNLLALSAETILVLRR